MREGEEVPRPRSYAKWDLQMGHVAGVEKCLIFWQWFFEWQQVGPGPVWWGGGIWVGKSVASGEWRRRVEHSLCHCGWNGECLLSCKGLVYPWHSIEDDSRKHWGKAQHTGLLFWDLLRTSSSSAYPRALFSVVTIKLPAIHAFKCLSLLWNVVGQTKAFWNLCNCVSFLRMLPE